MQPLDVLLEGVRIDVRELDHGVIVIVRDEDCLVRTAADGFDLLAEEDRLVLEEFGVEIMTFAVGRGANNDLDGFGGGVPGSKCQVLLCDICGAQMLTCGSLMPKASWGL